MLGFFFFLTKREPGGHPPILFIKEEKIHRTVHKTYPTSKKEKDTKKKKVGNG